MKEVTLNTFRYLHRKKEKNIRRISPTLIKYKRWIGKEEWERLVKLAKQRQMSV